MNPKGQHLFEIYTALSYVRVASYTSHTLPCLNDKQVAVKVISKDQQPLVNRSFNDYGNKIIFSGKIVTVSCFEDNSKVKEILAKDGTEKVLVVDSKASMNRALLGDMIAENAVKNNLQGIVINGCIRDAGTIATLDIGVKALGCNPIKTQKLDVGDINIPLSFAGIEFTPGDFIYGDANGLAISKSSLTQS